MTNYENLLNLPLNFSGNNAQMNELNSELTTNAANNSNIGGHSSSSNNNNGGAGGGGGNNGNGISTNATHATHNHHMDVNKMSQRDFSEVSPKKDLISI